jgi:hypothetical protein
VKNVGLQLYRKIAGVFPDVASIPTGEGNLLKFDNDRELHLNVAGVENETSILMLNFFKGRDEEACYEIHLDHTRKTASAETVRAETVQPLYSRLVQTERAPSKIRTLLSRSGRADENQTLFRNLQSLILNLDEVGTGKIEIDKGKTKQGRGGIEVYILQNNPAEATLEISPINIDGITRMTVAIDKKTQTAGVVEISGAFGRYPSYLAYPDGKEMLPAEREEYSRLLSDWLNKKTRFLGKLDTMPFNQK